MADTGKDAGMEQRRGLFGKKERRASIALKKEGVKLVYMEGVAFTTNSRLYELGSAKSFC